MHVLCKVFYRPLERSMGGPQGSCAGVQMYSVGTDDVDDASSLRDRPDWSRVEHPPGPWSETQPIVHEIWPRQLRAVET